jgi:hypothetical protein
MGGQIIPWPQDKHSSDGLTKKDAKVILVAGHEMGRAGCNGSQAKGRLDISIYAAE